MLSHLREKNPGLEQEMVRLHNAPTEQDVRGVFHLGPGDTVGPPPEEHVLFLLLLPAPLTIPYIQPE